MNKGYKIIYQQSPKELSSAKVNEYIRVTEFPI